MPHPLALSTLPKVARACRLKSLAYAHLISSFCLPSLYLLSSLDKPPLFYLSTLSHQICPLLLRAPTYS